MVRDARRQRLCQRHFDAGSGSLEPPSTCRKGPTGPDRGGPTGTGRDREPQPLAPIAGLGLALLMATLDIFEYLEVVHKRQRRHSSLGMLTPIEFENAFTVA
jgi:transposase InsO family protein